MKKLLSAITILTIASCTHYQPPEPAEEQVLESITSPESVDADGDWKGLCPRESVTDLDSMRRTVEADPVLRNEYAGFDWDNAVEVHTFRPTMGYVTHRSGTLIRETSKPIHIPAGDVYYDDGMRKIRRFCCNRLTIVSRPSHTPMEYVQPASPVGGFTDSLVPGGGWLYPSHYGGGGGVYLGGGYQGGDLTVNNYYETDYYCPISPPAPLQPSAPVPEPTTMILLGTGLLLTGLLRRKKR